MNSMKPAIIFVFAVVLGFSGHAWSKTPTVKNADDALALAAECNGFATDLYAGLRGDKPTNLFFSPYSVSLALAMTYAGAEGETAAQMAKTLHFAGGKRQVPPAFHTLQKILDSTDKTFGFELRIANRLWGQQGFHFLPAFLEVTRANFGADLGLLDFRQTEAARKTINSTASVSGLPATGRRVIS